MPVFLICFIVFILWFRVKMKQENKKTSTWDKNFWNREHDANFARKQDISHLDYIQVPENALPYDDTGDERDIALQTSIREISQRKMLNLSGMSNTDLKLTYGIANFPTLSTCDQNFSLFIQTLNKWGKYLLEEAETARHCERARAVFEYAVSIDSDIRETYYLLAKIYQQEGQISQIQTLLDKVEESDFFFRDTIIRHLQEMIQNYS